MSRSLSLEREAPTDSPLVSIIVTSYNYERYIGQTIQSVLSQTYPHWELIISDDGSTDNSLEVVRAFQDNRITLLTAETNKGASKAYNKAFALCKGKYLCSLDSDDYLAVDKLEKQVSYLEAHPEVDVLGTFINEIDAEGNLTGDKFNHEEWFNREIDLNQPESWFWRNHLNHSSVLMRKSVHDEVGLISEELIYAPDYELWAKCLAAKAGFAVFTENLTYYRYHGRNVTHKDPRRQFLENAYIFQSILLPYLLEIGRTDLVAESVFTFPFAELYSSFDENYRSRLVGRLAFSERKLTFQEFLEETNKQAEFSDSLASALIDRFHAARQEQQAHTDQLEESTSWLEDQRARWHAEAEKSAALLTEQQAWAGELERDKARLEVQLQEQREWIVTLESSKEWLEDQRARWQAEAEASAKSLVEQRASLVEQRAWIAELESGKTHVEKRRARWQAVAESKEILLQQLRSYTEELEKGKAWLEEQRNNWQATAEHLTELLQEQREWSETLERDKVWLEEQRNNWQVTAEHEKHRAEQLGQALAALRQSHDQLTAQVRQMNARSLAGRLRRAQALLGGRVELQVPKDHEQENER